MKKVDPSVRSMSQSETNNHAVGKGGVVMSKYFHYRNPGCHYWQVFGDEANEEFKIMREVRNTEALMSIMSRLPIRENTYSY